MSDFYNAVYDMVEKIPPGFVVSYVQIARALGKPRGARVVGQAMRFAPRQRHLPCHRVVNQAGEMSPTHVFGDKEMQRALLESEGVEFLLNGRINMKKCQWQGL